jgi:predicted transposase
LIFVGLQFKLELKKEDKKRLIKLMRKQSSAIRVAYNMLKELGKEKTKNPYNQIYQKLRQLFPELPNPWKGLAKRLFPLKPILVEGVQDRVRSRLFPLEAGGRPDEGFSKAVSAQPRSLHFIKMLSYFIKDGSKVQG